MNAIETRSNVQASATPVQLVTAACCCPECCADEQCATSEPPCC